MEYNGEGVEALVSVLEDMQNSNIILVDKKLRAALKCLAYYDEFRVALSYCNQGFDYDAEKQKSLLCVGERKAFKMPRSQKNIVALISHLLMEFDSGTMDLLTFASEYFPAENKQDSYEKCFVSVVEPFKLALVGLVVDGIEDDTPEAIRNVEFVSSGLQQQTEYLLVAFVKAVQEAQIEVELRNDFMIMFEGLASALDTRDTLMIRAMWLGIKLALTSHKLAQKDIEKMDEVLKMYLVVK
ncbi:MAG: hypothetical protein RSB09_00870 [Clostridia bacterium]